jgi:hypothetical protein
LPLGAAGVLRYVRATVAAALAVVSAPIRAATDGRGGLAAGKAGLVLRLLVAALLAVPLLLMFGALLVAADPVFARLVRTVFGIDFGRVASHAIVTVGLSWLAAGYLLALWNRGGTPDPGIRGGLPTLGLVEIGVPMVSLTVLFAAFIGVQAGYLFGGEAHVQATVGLSLAEYARRGFFELVAASGLMIPVVIGADLLLRQDDPRALRWFRWIARVQIVCVGILMVSALARLRIYYHAYGLTVDRLLAAAVMSWIGFTLAWFVRTVLRGRAGRFPLGAVIGGLVVLLAADTLNPEAMVARANVERAVAGAELDVRYLSRLSGDAVPTLAREADRLPPSVRDSLLSALADRWSGLVREDWRSWNLGHARARRALRESLAEQPR